MNFDDKDLSLITGIGILFIYVIKYVKKLLNKVSYFCIKTKDKKITFEDNNNNKEQKK